MNKKQEKSSDIKMILIFCLPFIVFMVFTFAEQNHQNPELQNFTGHTFYPYIYITKILIVCLTMSHCLIYWLREFPFHFQKISYWSFIAGIAGVVLWVGISKLNLETKISHVFGIQTETPLDPAKNLVQNPSMTADAQKSQTPHHTSRSAFNPFQAFRDSPVQAWLFFAFRMFGLALVVPLMEEFFLRGFLLRFVYDQNWTKISVGATSLAVWITVLIYSFTHPEFFAAFVWFSLITFLVMRTKNIWDAVTAHFITNFLLGMYVLYTGEWYFM
ncbi:MAG: CAAX prenyl protease-related protein [Planctomycetia bacterium]|nr:CAAX prenyl protease-related protein [Planctomycetia bacterium]